jgi:diaminopropionate ammonia-lyase
LEVELKVHKNINKQYIENGADISLHIEFILSFHKALPAYKPTPLVQLKELAVELGLDNLYIKDEGYRFGLKAFKSLGASYAIYNYLKKLSPEGLEPFEFLADKGKSLAAEITFTTATDGNHGRAVAWVSKLLGRPAIIYMPKGSVRSRVEAIKSEGAEVIIVNGGYDRAVATASEEAGRFGRVVISDTGYEGYTEIPSFIQFGYYTMFEEVRRELIINKYPLPDVIIIQAGVGAFAAAGIDYARIYFKDSVIFIVEPLSADCLLYSVGKNMLSTIPYQSETIMAGLNCGTPSLTAWETVKYGADYLMAIEDNWAEKAMIAYSIKGIVSGESGASGLAALLALHFEKKEILQEIKEKMNSLNVLLVNTEADTDPAMYHKITGLTADSVRKSR